MRILQINKFFYRRGGVETVFFDTIAGLRARGHDVAEFSTRDSRNLPSDYSSYFVENIGELTQAREFRESLSIFGKFFKNKEVAQNLQAIILATEPEVAHLHGIYRHLSAETFTVLKKMGVPIVLTVHDFFPLTPNRNFLCDGKVCEGIFKHRYYHCAVHKCVNGRFLPSVAGALEGYYYWLRGIWKMVDKFICPSEFMLNKLAQWGLAENKLTLIRNPFPLSPNCPPLGDKIIYLGRFHEEKGIKILMSALPWLRQYETIIAGNGPEEQYVENFIKQYSLTSVKKIGWVEKDKWSELMSQAKVAVMPSVFYENCSMAILEALGLGRLVVASNRGGNSELVKDNQTGFLVKPDDPESLARGIKTAMNLGAVPASEIAEAGRALVASNHNPSAYFDRLEEAYRNATLNKN